MTNQIEVIGMVECSICKMMVNENTMAMYRHMRRKHGHTGALIVGEDAVQEYIRQLESVVETAHRILMDTYTPEDATELHEELLPLLRSVM